MKYTCDKCGSDLGEPVKTYKPQIIRGQRFIRLRFKNGAVKTISYARNVYGILDEVPDNCIVYHKDGDSLNDDLDNLVLIEKEKVGQHLAKKYLKKLQFKPKRAFPYKNPAYTNKPNLEGVDDLPAIDRES